MPTTHPTPAAVRPSTVIYNCKRCKLGRRIEYPAKDSYGRPYRVEGGIRVGAGIYQTSSGWTMPSAFPGSTVVEQPTADGTFYRQYGGDPQGLCDRCRRPMTYGLLQATRNDAVRCDARCTGARGHSCDCSCGGENHGMAWRLGAPMLTKLVAEADHG